MLYFRCVQLPKTTKNTRDSVCLSVYRIDHQNWSTGAICTHDEVTKKRQRKKPYSGKVDICLDHPHCPIEISFGVVGGLSAVVINFKFHQYKLSGYQVVRGRNLSYPIT